MSNVNRSIFRDCPYCNSPGMSQTGQSTIRGKLRWYESVDCAVCGRQSEADGVGFPTEDVRLALIAKAGLWQVVMGASGQLPIVAKTLRDLLGLTPADAMRIAKSLPGPIYRGTRVEAEWLRDLLQGYGEYVRAELANSQL